MDEVTLNRFLLGGVVMACFTIGLFFLRFWRKTRDRLFAYFAIAFWLMGVNWGALVFTDQDEVRTVLYAVRFVAFLLILFAILEKNWARPGGVARA